MLSHFCDLSKYLNCFFSYLALFHSFWKIFLSFDCPFCSSCCFYFSVFIYKFLTLSIIIVRIISFQYDFLTISSFTYFYYSLKFESKIAIIRFSVSYRNEFYSYFPAPFWKARLVFISKFIGSTFSSVRRLSFSLGRWYFNEAYIHK